MHEAAHDYVRDARGIVPRGKDPLQILELGSYDVNGSVRDLFGDDEWYGIDIREGPNVDEVADAATWRSDREFDLVVSTEALEHMVYAADAVNTAWAALKPGGYFIATFASPERAAHSWNGGATMEPQEHYEGIHPQLAESWLDGHGWEIIELVENTDTADVYFTARKPE